MNKIYYLPLNIVMIITLIFLPFYVKREKEVSLLTTYVVVIDPGHGGRDNGCVNNDVYEDDINLSIGLYLYEELINLGFTTFLTRDGDYDLASENASNRKNEDLKNRVKLISSYNADICISLHVNYYQNDLIHGPMVYYKKDRLSKEVALLVQENLNLLSNENKIIHQEEFYLFKKVSCPCLLVECGFISNQDDLLRLTSSTYQKMIAGKISEGIVSYFLSKNKSLEN